MMLEIIGSGANHAFVRRKLSGDQTGIFKFTDPDDQIDAFFDWIDERIGRAQIDHYVGKSRQEFRQHWCNMGSAKG